MVVGAMDDIAARAIVSILYSILNQMKNKIMDLLVWMIKILFFFTSICTLEILDAGSQVGDHGVDFLDRFNYGTHHFCVR